MIWLDCAGTHTIVLCLALAGHRHMKKETINKMTEENLENELIAETDSFVVWRSLDEQDGYYYHIALGALTLHLTSEEWNELVLLIKSADA